MLSLKSPQNSEAKQIDPAKAALIQKAIEARAALKNEFYKYVLLKKYNSIFSLGIGISVGAFFWNVGLVGASALTMASYIGSYMGIHFAMSIGLLFRTIIKDSGIRLGHSPEDAEQNYHARVNNLAMHCVADSWKPLAEDEYLKNLLATLTAGATSPTFINGNLDRLSLQNITTTYQAKLWSRQQIAKLGGQFNRVPEKIIDKLSGKDPVEVLEKIRKKPGKYPPV